jgi:hypothetical protein
MIIPGDGDADSLTVLLRLSGCYTKLATLSSSPSILPMTLLNTQIPTAAQLGILRNGSVRALINGFGGRHRAHHILLDVMLTEGGAAELAKPVEQVAQTLGASGDSRSRSREFHHTSQPFCPYARGYGGDRGSDE